MMTSLRLQPLVPGAGPAEGVQRSSARKATTCDDGSYTGYVYRVVQKSHIHGMGTSLTGAEALEQREYSLQKLGDGKKLRKIPSVIVSSDIEQDRECPGQTNNEVWVRSSECVGTV